MRAVAVFPAQRQVRIIDLAEPKIVKPNDVKLRMLNVGICGTDKEIVAFQYGTPPAGSDYLIIGHESLAEVVETGSEVKNVRAGDLAVLTVRRPCPHANCIACRMGRQDFCYTGDFTERGIKERHGYMTEFVVENEKYVHLLPPSLREVGVLVEPLTIAEKAIEQLWEIQDRLPWISRDQKRGSAAVCNVVVLGAGPVGLLGAMAFQAAGFNVTVYSRTASHADKDDIVDAMGARFIAAETHTLEQMAEAVGRIDVVYEAVGASSLAFETVKLLGPNAIFIFTGVPGRKGPIEIDTDTIMRDMVLKNQVVYGTVNAPPQSFEAAIRDLQTFSERWPGAVKGIITGKYRLEDASTPLTGNVGGIKNVLAIA